MHRLILMAALAALLAGCRDSARDASDRADRAMAQVAELQMKVADLENEVADMGDALDQLDQSDGPDVISPDDADGPPKTARYAPTRRPANAFSIRASVRSTPKIATKEPKRGPWL